MAKLIYSALASLDGYVEDKRGNFEWAAPDDEVHAFVNDLERSIGTNLYGRRMYETMVFWETVSTSGDQPAVSRDFAEILASGRKDRLLADPPDSIERADADRARFRSGGDPAAQGVLGPRHLHRRRRARWRGDNRRPGRRMAPVPRPDCRRWRKARTAR